MNRLPRPVTTLLLWSLVAVSVLAIIACVTSPAARGKGKPPRLDIPVIDAHNHILPYVGRGETDFMGGARAARKSMEEYGISKVFLMPHPFVSSQQDSYTYKPLQKVAEKYPRRFMFLGGGGTLNIMLHDAVKQGTVTDAMRDTFRKTAEKIIADGAIGFGEMATEHFSLHAGHPYESAPSDHPLLLLLSDIAARLGGIPIDIHMEALPREMARPAGMPRSVNPPTFPANMEAFERLLAHNRATPIIWDHAGWDNTGYRTTELMAALLKRHSNLYMNIKIRKKGIEGGDRNTIFAQGTIDGRWLELLTAFPDRFMIGTDQFFQPAQAKEKRRIMLGGSVKLLRDLPPELARAVAYDTAARLFKVE